MNEYIILTISGKMADGTQDIHLVIPNSEVAIENAKNYFREFELLDLSQEVVVTKGFICALALSLDQTIIKDAVIDIAKQRALVKLTPVEAKILFDIKK